MSHLDPDRLVMLALSESTAADDEAVHLADCAGCRTEIDALKHVAGLGAETRSLRDLPPPPDRVWAGIAADVAHAGPAGHAPLRLPAAETPTRRTRRPRTARRWPVAVLSAAAAAVLAVVGTVAVTRIVDRPVDPVVTAKAALAPLATAPATARGDAWVLADDELRVDVSNLPLSTGYYEVWLIDPDSDGLMKSIGSLPNRTDVTDRTDVTLPIPPGTDLNRYRLVDISAEPHDGKPTHSGDSLLRGTLTS